MPTFDLLELYKDTLNLCLKQDTDKKEKWIFLIYTELQKGSGAKSYTEWLTASS